MLYIVFHCYEITGTEPQTLEKKVDALADFTEAFTNSNG